jgi:hypothetical protein
MVLSLRKTDQRWYDSDLIRNSVIWAAIFAILVPAFAPACAARRGPLSPGTAQAVDQEELLWWLPADTESVVAARGPFSFPVPKNDEDEDKEQESENKKVSQSETFQEFEQQPLELFYSSFVDLVTPFRGSTVAFAIQGSRHFRHPLPGYEVMEFEGCSIVVFENDLGNLKDNLMQALARQVTSKQVVAETEVLVFHQKDGDAEWDEFLAVPRPNVLLVANNLPYLQEVLERMAQRKNLRALPAQLPEWRFLNPDARFWGLRHYDRTQAKEDATSPFGEDRTFDPGDQQAIGVLFALDPSNPREAVFTYFSGDEGKIRDLVIAGTSVEDAETSGVEVTVRDAPGGGTVVEVPEESVKHEIELRSPIPGVIERAYTLNRTTVLMYFILNMEIGLGRGMYF